MEKPNYDINKYKKKDTKACKTFWQETAKQICEEFNITGTWKDMIFQKAKNNLTELNAKVQYCREEGKINGRYLIAMYRKKQELCQTCKKEIKRTDKTDSITWTDTTGTYTEKHHVRCRYNAINNRYLTRKRK